MIFSKLVLAGTFGVIDDRWSTRKVVQVKAEVVDRQQRCRDM
jgi:hypothetical protein